MDFAAAENETIGEGNMAERMLFIVADVEDIFVAGGGGSKV